MKLHRRWAPLLVVAWSTRAEAHEIEHVVVAMLENRAFDHMLGYYNRIDPRIDGLRGDECNVRNLTDPAAGKECVNDEALDHCPYDPDHSFGTLPPIQPGTSPMPLPLPLPLLARCLAPAFDPWCPQPAPPSASSRASGARRRAPRAST
jgi:hypothetical protein